MYLFLVNPQEEEEEEKKKKKKKYAPLPYEPTRTLYNRKSSQSEVRLPDEVCQCVSHSGQGLGDAAADRVGTSLRFIFRC